eukprot:TRINITY_DN8318_c0_g1_i1.p2 TRINITY_DN8318_c0_g1~~TRINITY_DN8318_c0_g1_i1.p2  ORF type:complete len:130 (-),score=11.05 TRINITY_DN8318_c0_g1_i1:38-427(-)
MQNELSRDQILQFIADVFQLLDQKETKLQLKEAFENGKDVENLITQLQMQLFQQQQIDGKHGIEFLSRVSEVYKTDPEVLTAFYGLVEREELALDEVELDPHEYAQKYRLYIQQYEQRQKMLKAKKRSG